MDYGNDRIVMYLHGGSGNHGCEAIVNSTCHMMEDIPKILVTVSEQEDRRYTLEPLCDILEERKIAEHFFAHAWYYAWRKVFRDPESFMRYRFHDVLGKNLAPLYLSVGGDMYCYELSKKEAVTANSAFNRAGAKTVLWGCSLEPELLQDPKIVEDMRRYALITSRESITTQALAEAGITENVKQFPDPAFALEPEETKLPHGFLAGNTVGINISPMILRHENENGITIKNYRNLMDYILENTDCHIALIPHVMWRHNDDRLTANELYSGYQSNERVILFEDMSCQKIKYIISKCRFFIGARTHATIAAYSSCVPTLVVGYSVKARGIARDLFGAEEHYVLPVQDLADPEELIGAFSWILEHEEEIRGRLQAIMPDYCKKAAEAGDEIRGLWNRLHENPAGRDEEQTEPHGGLKENE
ncbi:MAG: polysaccharide pyruvyl transferase family protein [Bacteroidales bacterium]|nr:polysaccharide pyruvyl transferase family protein [Bacteroidales bacterium]MCM1414562.1 polysaccharide pyruvyl transferase family protein [bacterium]MCM1422612.1 polysaccharide pyruvyl transferase family protein [bacterium]